MDAIIRDFKYSLSLLMNSTHPLLDLGYWVRSTPLLLVFFAKVYVQVEWRHSSFLRKNRRLKLVTISLTLLFPLDIIYVSNELQVFSSCSSVYLLLHNVHICSFSLSFSHMISRDNPCKIYEFVVIDSTFFSYIQQDVEIRLLRH